MSALDEVVDLVFVDERRDDHVSFATSARAELAALRATVAEQARQLSEARRIMVNIVEIANITDSAIPSGVEKWLASTAPAQPGHPLNCAWDNVASDDFDGCNGCAFCCATGDTPPAQPDAPAVTLDLRDSEMP